MRLVERLQDSSVIARSTDERERGRVVKEEKEKEREGEAQKGGEDL